MLQLTDANADYVKFQTFKAEKLVTKSADKAEYQQKNAGNEHGQLDMLKKLELSRRAIMLELIELLPLKKYKISFPLPSMLKVFGLLKKAWN